MPHRLLALLSVASLLLASCGNDPDAIILAGNTQTVSDKGETVYQNAKLAEAAGKTRRAIKLYDQVATRYPFAPSAAQARFRQAELLDQQGKIEDSFDAYGKYLERFPGSGHYAAALSRQAAIAQAAAEGKVKSSFLGIKTKLSLEKSVAMLGQVRDHAPKSATAAKAQFTIGSLYESKHKSKEAIDAYRQLVRDQPTSPDAPDALFRVGLIMIEDAERGNQNQANVDLARETFNDYLIQYPGHPRNAEAHKLIASLDHRDLQRSLEIAEFYMKTHKPESAKVYYRDIVRHSNSGPQYTAAKARLKQLGE